MLISCFGAQEVQLGKSSRNRESPAVTHTNLKSCDLWLTSGDLMEPHFSVSAHWHGNVPLTCQMCTRSCTYLAMCVNDMREQNSAAADSDWSGPCKLLGQFQEKQQVSSPCYLLVFYCSVMEGWGTTKVMQLLMNATEREWSNPPKNKSHRKKKMIWE